MVVLVDVVGTVSVVIIPVLVDWSSIVIDGGGEVVLK
jgi:hypothetical protein